MYGYEISFFAPNATAQQTSIPEITNTYYTMRDVANAISTNRPWAPATFTGSRANGNLKAISLLALDFDSGMKLSEAFELFKDYKHIIGTSKSHQIEKNGVVADRFRVLLVLEYPIHTDADFKSHWFAAFAKWPSMDKACKDSARFFFPCTKIVSVNEEGLLFAERMMIPEQQPRAKENRIVAKGKLSKLTKDFLVDGAPDGEWHGRFLKAAMDFKEQGYLIEDTRLKLTMVTGVLDSTDEQQLLDVYENRPSKYGPRGLGFISDWPKMISTKDGEKLHASHPANFLHLLSKLGYEFRFNEMDLQLYSNDRLVHDGDIAEIWHAVKSHGLQQSKDFIISTMEMLGRKNFYHPIRDSINSVAWDGVDRITELYKTLSIDGDEDYSSYLTKWLIGICAKIYKPGAQNLVLTFVGAQGIGKSRWLTKLALHEESFGEGSIDPSNKDHELRHLNYLIWHIPELDYTTGKRETGALKDYLTRDFVSVRPAYARFTRKGRSMCSFAASVNTDEFLIDQTGNRRFMVIPLLNINAEHKIDIQQVFAQAKVLLDSGVEWWLDKEAAAELEDRNSRFEIMDAVAAFVQTLQSGDDHMTIQELCALAGIPEPSMSILTRMGAALKRRGFKKTRARVGEGRVWLYLLKNPNGSKVLKIPRPV